MKKLFFAALLTLAVAGSAFATDVKKVNSSVLNSFKNEFKKASDVTWKTGTGYVKATFTLDNQQKEVFYNQTGDMIASSTVISLDKLPAEAKRTFAKKYEGYNVKEAIRFEGTEENAYYISAENENESVIVKIDDYQKLSIFKRTKK